MKYYIIAGEASGDLHASNLVKQLKLLDDNAVFRGWGGELMKDAGVELVRDYKDTAYMGFIEVVSNLNSIFKNLRFCKKDILLFQPDALILVDYPGFNLRIAQFAKNHNLNVFYYISPQVWAWKASRVHKIVENSKKVFTILPFEKRFYFTYGYDVEFVGHPLLDAIESYQPPQHETFLTKNNLSQKPIIALLPGSRKQEITKMLPIMLETARKYLDYQFVVAGVSSVEEDMYGSVKSFSNVKVIFNQTYDLLHFSSAAMVASGTATLEAALLNVPMLVCYKANSLSYAIAKRIVHIDYISLVNLIAEKQVVIELIQDDCNIDKLCSELYELLNNEEYRINMRKNYSEIISLLGGYGASKRTAFSIYSFIKQQ